MHYKIIFLALFLPFNLYCSETVNFENLPFKKNIKEKILDGRIFSEANVKNLNLNKEQSLSYSIAGLHPKSCTYALKTLSLYEEFSHFLSFVKISHYDEKNQQIDFLLSHTLMPYDMRLVFTLPRITSAGEYPFSFGVGMLKNLKGVIYISDYKSRCLFYTKASWTGPHTGISPMVLELFSQALSSLSMEILFRISSSLSH